MVAYYNENKKCTGVICDRCGKVTKEKFVYYSIKVTHVQVDVKMNMKNGITDVDDRYLDLDFCEECFNALREEVKKNLDKISKAGAWSSSTEAPDKVVHKQRMG